MAKKNKDLEEEKILKVVKRIEEEEKGQERIEIRANLISAPPGQIGASVKITLKIKDPSFYAKAGSIVYSAGTDEFEEISMQKIDLDNFAAKLENIPRETAVLYYVKILDKSGEWVQYPRPYDLKEEDAETEPYYQFTVEANGSISYKKMWDDTNLTKCPVCGYMCYPTWDECPECNTPLYDTYQEIFEEDQKEKEERLQKRKELEEEIAWSEAQGTAESWRGLPECPNCGYNVQVDWVNCPVCSYDLSRVKLEKKPAYAEEDSYKPEEEQIAPKELKEKSKKEKEKKVPFVPSKEDIDIL